MKIEEMVEEINKAVNGTLSITHFVNWELSSYRDHSLFAISEDKIAAKSFKELIEKGYARLKKEGIDDF